MSIFRCEECEQYIDGDFEPCVEHPTEEDAYICELCADKLKEQETALFKSMRAEYNRERA